MRKNFIDHHLLRFLKQFASLDAPLDFLLSKYFKGNKALGSHDRKLFCSKLYALVRFKLLIDHFLPKEPSWEERLLMLQKLDLKKQLKNPALPEHIRVAFPFDLFQLLKKDYGRQQALQLCRILNSEAPFTIRANCLKISRDNLLQRLVKKYSILSAHTSCGRHQIFLSKTEHSPFGIVFGKRENLFSLEEFKKGLFEVQDEGSQLIADLAPFQKGERILDFCAGSGGKTLAFAYKLKGKGQIFLYDVRKSVLYQAQKRLKRAGIQNAQTVFSYKKLKPEFFHGIFLDVPCSGFGALRRNPDMKYKFSVGELKELAEKQRNIFKQAFTLLKKGGHIVYATCSIFACENEEQIKFFRKNYPVRVCKTQLLLPKADGHDGFFAAVLQKL